MWLQQGDRQTAEPLLRELIELPERAPESGVVAYALAAEALIAQMDGKLEVAVEAAHRLPGDTGLLQVRVGVTRTLFMLGRVDDYFAMNPTSGAWEAYTFAQAGRREEAQTILDTYDPGGAALDVPLMVLDGSVLLEDEARARALSDHVVEMWQPVAALWPTITDRHLGEAYAFLGEVDEALIRFEAAIKLAERMPWRPELAIARFGRAKLLLAHDPDGRAEALADLDWALGEFREMKMQPYVEEALRIRLEERGIDSSDPQTSLISLTTSVDEQRPDVASHAAPDGTVTLLFSDIEDSTQINVELGDDAWRSLLDEHDALCRRAIAAHGGYEVKTVGDAFMVAFGSARAAVRCARDMQQAMTERNGDAEHPIRIRIGLHTGEPVQQADDFYGTDVVLASRLCSAGDGGDILVSSLLRELVASSGEFELTAREPVALKGLEGEHVTYAVGWA